MSDFHENLQRRAAARPRRIVFPEGNDPRTLEAVARLQLARLLQCTVIGDEAVVRAGVTEFGGDPSQIEIVDLSGDARLPELTDALAARRASKGWTLETAREHLRNPLVFGAMLVSTGHAHGSVAGAVNTTGDVIRAGIWCIGLASGITTISSSFYMVVPPLDRNSVV